MKTSRARPAVAAALALAVAVVVGAVLLSGYDGRGARARRPVPPAAPGTATGGAGTPAARPDGQAGRPTAAAVLHSWDRRRAAAYAAGDPAALRRLYARGSTAADADLRVLRGYLRRGLRVEAMRMQLLDVTVLDRSRGLLRLRCTDRLVGAVAVGAAGRQPLPRDRASTRVLTLVRDRGGAWRVRSVRPVSG